MSKKEYIHESSKSWKLIDYHTNNKLISQYNKLKAGLILVDDRSNVYKIVKLDKKIRLRGPLKLPDASITLKLIKPGPSFKNPSNKVGYTAPIWYSNLVQKEPIVMDKFKIDENVDVVGVFPGENPRAAYMFYYVSKKDGAVYFVKGVGKRPLWVAKNLKDFIRMVKNKKILAVQVKGVNLAFNYNEPE